MIILGWGREESRKTPVWEQVTKQICDDNAEPGKGTIPEKSGLEQIYLMKYKASQSIPGWSKGTSRKSPSWEQVHRTNFQDSRRFPG